MEPGQSVDGPDPLTLLREFQTDIYSATYVNDLEPPAFAVLPMLKDLRDDLSKFGFQVSARTSLGSSVARMSCKMDSEWG